MLNALSFRVPRLTAVYAPSASSRPLGTGETCARTFRFQFSTLPTGRGRGDCVRCLAARMSSRTLDFQARGIPSIAGSAERVTADEIGLAENQSCKLLVHKGLARLERIEPSTPEDEQLRLFRESSLLNEIVIIKDRNVKSFLPA